MQGGQTPTDNKKALLIVPIFFSGSGFSLNGVFPLDTAVASGVFFLRHGDVIRVLPDNWSLGCLIHTDPIKTHMDIFLVKAMDLPG